MTLPTAVLTGTRIALPPDYDRDFECTACGRGLRGHRQVVAVAYRTEINTVMYSLVHDQPACLVVVMT